MQIQTAFRKAQEKQTAALMPYFTLGYPDIETSLDIIESVAANSDLLELGIPFSDPVMDGPTIQEASDRALAAGMLLHGGNCMGFYNVENPKGTADWNLQLQVKLLFPK